MTTSNLNLNSSTNQEIEPIQNLAQNLMVLETKPEITPTIAPKAKPVLTIADIPYDYYELVKEAFRKDNFKFAEILLNQIPFGAIFPENASAANRWNQRINWFDDKKVFNFLFERARKAKKIKNLHSVFDNNNLSDLCKYATHKQFKLIASKIRKNYWFLKNSWCLTNAITSNNYLIVKELIQIAKSCPSVSICLIREHLKISQIGKWFFEEGADLRSLKLIQDEFQIDLSKLILNELVESIIDNYQYENKNKNLLGFFKKVVQFFKVKKLNFSNANRLLQKISFDKALFFFVYNKLNKDNFLCISYRCFLSILYIQDSDVVVAPEVGKFLLRKNIELINAKIATEKQQQN